MINIPINATMKGKFRWELIDEKTGKTKDKSDGYVENLITDSYLNKLFTQGNRTWFNWENYGGDVNPGSITEGFAQMSNLGIGSGSTPESVSDTGLENALSISPDNITNFDRSQKPVEFPVWVERKFEFNAGNGTGTINEIATYSSGIVSRKVLNTPIEKTETDILIVYYRYEFDIPQRHYTGTIVGGQRDGVTDIKWDIYITDDMVYNTWTEYQFAGNDEHNVLCGLINYRTANPTFVIGDDNSASNTQNDIGLKGNQLSSGSFDFIEPDSYINNSFQRSSRIGLEENKANVQISELLLFPHTSVYSNEMLRFTFDPALDNVANFRLYFDLTVSLGSAT